MGFNSAFKGLNSLHSSPRAILSEFHFFSTVSIVVLLGCVSSVHYLEERRKLLLS